mgnify:CR=1 FL=1
MFEKTKLKNTTPRNFRSIIFLLLIISFQGIAQLSPEQISQVDSLKEVIQKSPHDSVTVKAWKAWDDIIYFTDPSLDSILLEKVVLLSKENLKKDLSPKEREFFTSELARGLNYFGTALISLNHPKEAIPYFEEAIPIYKKANLINGLDGCKINLGNAHYNEGNIKEAIIAYCDKLKETCDNFPLYRLKHSETDAYDTKLMQLSVKDYLESITSNKKLQAVLAGSNFLYAGDGYRTPFYVHALSVNSYIQSSYRCVNGGSQITKSLIKRLKENGGEVYNHQEVVNINADENGIISVETSKGNTVSADLFISNIEPKLTLDLIGEKHFRKAYFNRVKNIENVIGCFSLYIVLKPNTFPYLNKNYYHFKQQENVWNSQHYDEKNWPESYMFSMGVKKNTEKYGDNITVMTYMRFEEVETWKNSFNTVADKNERGQTYDEFKAEKAELILVELEKKFPNIRECILSVHTSSPLSYRDYIGSDNGAMYGYVKDVESPMASYISAKTKIKNLFFTGQSLSMHGILGVTIGAVVSCSAILGKKYLLDKIFEHNLKQEVS